MLQPFGVLISSVMAVLIALCVAAPGFAQSRPTVDITPGKARAFRAGVQRFADSRQAGQAGQAGQVGGGGRAREVRLAIEEALVFSGALLPLPREAYLAPHETLHLSQAPRRDCNDWAQSGADALLEGQILDRAARAKIEFQVWDVTRCRLLLIDEVEGKIENLDQLAKEVADLTAAAFTGIRGVANTEFAFVSDRSGRRELYLMSADGTHQRAASNNPAIKSFPAWYPDSTAVVYTAHYPSRQPTLALSSRGPLTAGLFLTQILPGVPKYRGVFSPDGQAIAFVSSVESAAEIFSVRRNGSGLRRLTHSAAIEVAPAWSPDGSQLAFVSDRTGSPQIYIMDRDGRNTRRLTFQGSYNTGPAWSPDGRWIAFETRLESQFDIWLIDPLGETSFPLVGHSRSDETPTWAPNSRKLAFSSNRRGLYDVYVIDITGENLKRLTNGAGSNIQPAWGPYSR